MKPVLFQENDRVLAMSECNSKGELGTVTGICKYPDWYKAKYITVKLDNGLSQNYNEVSLKKIENKEEEECYKMSGDYKIAIVNLYEDYNQKDYGFALYDNANEGDLVVVNPQNRTVLGVIKQVLTKEEYVKPVTKEVVAVVDTSTYDARVDERERRKEIEREKKELQRMLDFKIAKMRDMEYYERAAKDYSDRDPEITELVNRLKQL